MPSGVRVEGAVLEVLAQFEELARARGIEFRVEADLRIETHLPESELRVILKELVANAMQAAKRGGWVRVCVQPDPEYVLISVKDNGRGLSAPKLRSALNARIGGFGRLLGVVRAGGGRLWANSKAGKGSTFYVALPR
ncbi:MAG: ATP-binding protein [Elusimicrobia bacterium]|nr:ATP-binding protein [Elusimicrobiota bacterium]